MGGGQRAARSPMGTGGPSRAATAAGWPPCNAGGPSGQREGTPEKICMSGKIPMSGPAHSNRLHWCKWEEHAPRQIACGLSRIVGGGRYHSPGWPRDRKLPTRGHSQPARRVAGACRHAPPSHKGPRAGAPHMWRGRRDPRAADEAALPRTRSRESWSLSRPSWKAYGCGCLGGPRGRASSGRAPTTPAPPVPGQAPRLGSGRTPAFGRRQRLWVPAPAQVLDGAWSERQRAARGASLPPFAAAAWRSPARFCVSPFPRTPPRTPASSAAWAPWGARAQGDAGGLLQKRAGRQRAGGTYRGSLTLPPSQGPARAHGQSRSRVLDHSPDHGDGDERLRRRWMPVGLGCLSQGRWKGEGEWVLSRMDHVVGPMQHVKMETVTIRRVLGKGNVTECIRVVVGRVPKRTRKRREVSRWEDGTASGADETSRGASMSSLAVAEVRSV